MQNEIDERAAVTQRDQNDQRERARNEQPNKSSITPDGDAEQPDCRAQPSAARLREREGDERETQ